MFSWLTNKAIEMRAHMTSAKIKRLNSINIKSVNGTEPSPKDIRKAVKEIHKEHKRRRKMLNQRRKTNQLMRKARLTKRFQLKMESKGVPSHDKELKKFLKSRFKKNNDQQFLTPKEIEKLQTISRSLGTVFDRVVFFYVSYQMSNHIKINGKNKQLCVASQKLKRTLQSTLFESPSATLLAPHFS